MISDEIMINESNDGIRSESPTDPAELSSRFPSITRHTYEEQSAHDENLRRELENVRQVNDAIEGVLQSLGKAKNNMKTVNQTVNAASTLLKTWTRILSQAEHNQRLILDPSWHGASQDIADIEEEALEKRRAADKREAEELEKRLAAARQAEAEEKRKAELQAKQAKAPSRSGSRVGGTARGTKASSSSHVQMGNSSNNTTGAVKRGTSAIRRPTSGIGRGVSVRGSRGRG